VTLVRVSVSARPPTLAALPGHALNNRCEPFSLIRRTMPVRTVRRRAALAVVAHRSEQAYGSTKRGGPSGGALCNKEGSTKSLPPPKGAH
jgi:hypothetical protein